MPHFYFLHFTYVCKLCCCGFILAQFTHCYVGESYHCSPNIIWICTPLFTLPCSSWSSKSTQLVDFSCCPDLSVLFLKWLMCFFILATLLGKKKCLFQCNMHSAIDHFIALFIEMRNKYFHALSSINTSIDLGRIPVTHLGLLDCMDCWIA